jgi:AcrR family transcriptional regulator
MSPRPYRLGQRQVLTDETRSKILEAARAQLETESSFSIDAVARRADVARMTVYYQFGSKRGLLEAVFDSLAARGGMRGMPAAFQQVDPAVALQGLIDVFARFWSSDREVLRRLRAMATLDPELDEVLRERNEGRRQGLRVIISRLQPLGGGKAMPASDLVDLLFALTSFENFDVLAGPERTPEEVAPLVKRAADAIVGAAVARSKTRGLTR